jgi:hypothetical protein
MTGGHRPGLLLTAKCRLRSSTTPKCAAPWFPEVLVFNDYARFQSLGDRTEQDTANHLTLVGSYFADSTALATTKVQAILVGQVTFTTPQQDPLKTLKGGDGLDAALIAFGAYLAASPPGSHPAHDAAILITGRESFKGPAVEATCIGGMCDPVVSVAVVQATSTLAFDSQTIAHALGHLLGMCHDPPASRPTWVCPGLSDVSEPDLICGGRIMAAAPSLSSPATQFSRCSQVDLEGFLSEVPSPSCLVLPGSAP